MGQAYPNEPGPGGPSPWQAGGPGAPMASHAPAVDFAAIEEQARVFIMKTFAWMAVGLGITGVVAMVAAGLSITETAYGEVVLTPIGEIIFSPIVMYGSMGVTLLMVFALSATIQRLSPAVAGAVFFAYAALNGVWLTAIFLVYTAQSIAATFFVTAGMFGFTALFGYLTKRDLSGLGSFAMMGLIGLILATIANFFIASEMLYWLLTYAGVVIFVGLTAYDMQKLRQLGGLGMDERSAAQASILGALTLYLDFINLFLFLLRLFGRRR